MTLKQNLTRRIYALVPVPLESEALQRHGKRSSWGGFANCLGCCGLLALVVASSVPAFLVTRVNGSADILAAHISVDVVVGDGLWTRGQCFGESADSVKELLQKVGLSCDGVPQTQKCARDDLSSLEQDHCNRFYVAQGMEVLAMGSLFIAILAGTSNREGLLPALLRGIALSAALVASMAGSSVLSLLQDSYMFTRINSEGQRIVDESSLQYQCATMFGLSVCHGPGFSFQLQAFGSALASMSAIVSLVLLLTNRVSGDSPTSIVNGHGATLVYVEEPLLGAEQGIPRARVVGN